MGITAMSMYDFGSIFICKGDFMNTNKLLKFLIGIVLNITFMLIMLYAIIFITGRSYNMGHNIASDLTTELESVEIEIEIPDGVRVNDIANILADAGVINSSLFFRVENILKGTNYTLREGVYTLNTEMDSNDIVNTLIRDNTVQTDIVITIKEGFRLKDIAEYLESKGFFTAEEFLYAAENAQFSHSFLKDIPDRENRLEGYLFPDTYYVFPNSTPEMIVNRMLTRFEEIYLRYALEIEESKMTMDEIITIASIIEKEIVAPHERELASQVIYNRLEINMPLQMCSSVLYVLEKQRDRLLLSDLEVESPYNTYINHGLPIGPISNPGEASIKAALRPSEGNLLYFVLKNDNSGEHVFTHDYNEFLRAKEQYNQLF